MLQQNPHTNDDVLLGLQFSVIYTLKSKSLVPWIITLYAESPLYWKNAYEVSLFSQWIEVEALLNGHSRKWTALL